MHDSVNRVYRFYINIEIVPQIPEDIPYRPVDDFKNNRNMRICIPM